MTTENSPARQQEVTIEALLRKVDSIEVRMHEIRTRLAAMETEHLDHQGLNEKFNGQKMRIDRMLDTTDDLLKRFEAWKSVGNEMGDNVRALTDVQLAQGEHLKIHSSMLEQLVMALAALRDFMREIQRILDVRPRIELPTLPGDDTGSAPVTS